MEPYPDGGLEGRAPATAPPEPRSGPPTAGMIEAGALGASIARASNDVVFVLDLDARAVVYVNEAVEETLGYDPAEVISLGPRVFGVVLHPEDLARAGARLGELHAMGASDVREIRFRAVLPSGGHRRMLGRLVVFQSTPEGAVRQLLGTLRPAEDPASDQAQSFAAAVASANRDAVCVFDVAADRVVRCNDEITALLGFTPAQIMEFGSSFVDRVVSPDHRAALRAAIAGAVDPGAGPVAEVTFLARAADGSPRWVSARHVAVTREPDGRAARVLATLRDVTGSRVAEGAREESDRAYQLIAEHARDVIMRVTPDGTIRYVSPSASKMLGYAPGDLVDTPYVSDRVHPEDLTRVVDDFQAVVRGSEAITTPHRLRHHDGAWMWTESTVHPVLDPFGTLREIVVVTRDVTTKVAAERAQDASEKRFRRLFDAAPVGVAVTDIAGAILYGNAALFELFGPRHDRFKGRNLLDMFDESSAAAMRRLRARVLAGELEVGRGEGRVTTTAGTSRWCLVTNVRFPLDDGRVGILSHLQDISPLVQARAELARQAMRDPLTGLANRLVAVDHLRSAIETARTEGGRVAVIFIDVDNFKRVNDSLGHSAGDELIVAVARRLESAAPPDALVARLGGDEFVMVVDEREGGQGAVQTAELVARALRQPMVVHGQEVVTSVSVGIAISEPDSEPESLLRDADAAMYEAKSRGRAHWVMANPRMRAAAHRELRLESELRRAVVSEELVLHYQPVVDPSGRIVSAEALLRWQHPVRGIELPGLFLDVAESSDLIVAIGDQVLEMACAEGARWQRDYPGLELRVAFNVAARQLGYRRFAAKVAEVLSQTGLDPRRLIVEVTESQFVEAVPTALAELEALSRLGVSVAVDDFGTGFAGLTQLKSLPAQIVKLDRSFVAGLGVDRADTAIVEAVIGLARATDRLLVAEGVETDDQWRLLRELGCPRGQGYLLHRPMTAEAFRAVIARGAGGALAGTAALEHPDGVAAGRVLLPNGEYYESGSSPPG